MSRRHFITVWCGERLPPKTPNRQPQHHNTVTRCGMFPWHVGRSRLCDWISFRVLVALRARKSCCCDLCQRATICLFDASALLKPVRWTLPAEAKGKRGALQPQNDDGFRLPRFKEKALVRARETSGRAVGEIMPNIRSFVLINTRRNGRWRRWTVGRFVTVNRFGIVSVSLVCWLIKFKKKKQNPRYRLAWCENMFRIIESGAHGKRGERERGRNDRKDGREGWLQRMASNYRNLNRQSFNGQIACLAGREIRCNLAAALLGWRLASLRKNKW